MDYYLGYAVSKKQIDTENMEQIITHIEHVVDSYRKGLIEFIIDYPKWSEPPIGEEELKQVVEKYNQIVKQFSEAAKQYAIGDFSENALLITLQFD